MKLTKPLSKVFAFVFFMLFAGSAMAASIGQVKGNKALIQLQGLPVQPGTELYAINAEQKRKALLKVSQVKGDQAVADITQGTAAAGMMIIIKSSAGGGAPPATAAAPAPVYGSGGSANNYPAAAKKYKKGWGIIGGLAMNTMGVTVKTTFNPTGEALALKGTSFNVKGILDYHLSNSFTLRGATGLEGLNVTGTSATDISGNNSCSNASSCALAINYLTFEASGQLNLATIPHRFWVGAGFGFLIAMSKGNNISNLEASSTNQVLLLGGGADFKLSNTMYMPIVFEYGLFPFAGIQLSALYLRGGIAWKF